MDTDIKDVASTIAKLEEARIVLNRLIGPGGSLTEAERQKYLKSVVGAGAPEPKGPLGGIGVTAPSQKALQAPQSYQYGGVGGAPGTDPRSQRGKAAFNQYGGG
jgi:hypothetical protein